MTAVKTRTHKTPKKMNGLALPDLGTMMRQGRPFDPTAGPSRKIPRLAGESWPGGDPRDFLIGIDMPNDQVESQARVVHRFVMIASRKNRFTQDAGRFSPLWMMTGKSDPRKAKPATGTGVTPNSGRQGAMTTHVLNYHLAMLTYTSPDLDCIPTPEWVRNNFRLCGVLHSDKGDTSYQNGERVVTVDRQNPKCQVSNVWPAGTRHGDFLWFIVKYVKVDHAVAYEPVSAQTAQHVFTFRSDGVELEHPGYLVQIVPHSTRVPWVEREPLCTVVEYNTGRKLRLYGYEIPIGRVTEDKFDDAADPLAAMRSADKLANCPLMTVLMKV